MNAAGCVRTALPITAQWLAARAQGHPTARAAVVDALVALLQHPQPMLGLDGAVAAVCPETLSLDAGRITTLQVRVRDLGCMHTGCVCVCVCSG